MNTYRVTVTGTAREVYIVENAISPQDAMDRWHEGTHVLTEVMDCEPESAEIAD